MYVCIYFSVIFLKHIMSRATLSVLVIILMISLAMTATSDTEWVASFSSRQLRGLLKVVGVPCASCVEKDHLVDRVVVLLRRYPVAIASQLKAMSLRMNKAPRDAAEEDDNPWGSSIDAKSLPPEEQSQSPPSRRTEEDNDPYRFLRISMQSASHNQTSSDQEMPKSSPPGIVVRVECPRTWVDLDCEVPSTSAL